MPTMPTDFDTLLADDFRAEIGNKVTAVGMFLGNDVQIPNNVKLGPNVALPIAFVTRLKNGSGKWKGRWEIFDANNKSVLKSINDFDVTKSAALHGVITKTMIPIANLGVYRYVLTLENTNFEFQFEVKQ